MPDVQELPEEVESIACTAEDDNQVELLLAGFRACAKEAIRFLLEEEGLAPDHSLPIGLLEHLDRQQTHLAGMLRSDSITDNDESFYDSPVDDRSFISSETSDVGYCTERSKLQDSSILSNASIDSSTSENNADEQQKTSNG